METKNQLKLYVKIKIPVNTRVFALRHNNVSNTASLQFKSLYRLASIAPPSIKRDTLTKCERDKQLSDNRHPLYGYQKIRRRLKSRNSFVTTNGLGNRKPLEDRLELWKDANQLLPSDCIPEPSESLPPGSSFCRKDWVALNRARAKVGRTGDDLA
ncbi:hypothetical protein Pcinc_020885 [Petrolisthes cinctipes]|uniref:Uncharacterized protein n=1 Tax=Petrolisthes cinctipes TaxID=88211 RepID=A0AAE1FH19_PETCI|nr:hypothetical protein Pcinc_020885 [Petrolisthes cinctipes]